MIALFLLIYPQAKSQLKQKLVDLKKVRIYIMCINTSSYYTIEGFGGTKFILYE